MTSDGYGTGAIAQAMDQYKAKELRDLAHDMPYRKEARKDALVVWLLEHHPERLEKVVTTVEVDPNPNIGPDTPAPPLSSGGMQETMDDLGSTLEELIGEARAKGIPALLGSCTVSLHFEIEDASTPLEAVEDVVNQIMREGLSRWTWLVRDEITDEVYGVTDGTITDLKVARVAPE